MVTDMLSLCDAIFRVKSPDWLMFAIIYKTKSAFMSADTDRVNNIIFKWHKSYFNIKLFLCFSRALLCVTCVIINQKRRSH